MSGYVEIRFSVRLTARGLFPCGRDLFLLVSLMFCILLFTIKVQNINDTNKKISTSSGNGAVLRPKTLIFNKQYFVNITRLGSTILREFTHYSTFSLLTCVLLDGPLLTAYSCAKFFFAFIFRMLQQVVL